MTKQVVCSPPWPIGEFFGLVDKTILSPPEGIDIMVGNQNYLFRIRKWSWLGLQCIISPFNCCHIKGGHFDTLNAVAFTATRCSILLECNYSYCPHEQKIHRVVFGRRTDFIILMHRTHIALKSYTSQRSKWSTIVSHSLFLTKQTNNLIHLKEFCAQSWSL